MRQFFIEAYQRFKLPTPIFFKKIQRLAASLVVAGLAIQGLQFVPHVIASIGATVAWAAGTSGILVQLVVTNTEPITPDK